jgi:cellulose synthase/poly-beta-1,6-N-acetylglucosamine synthase-like glycosyltransferase
MTLLIGWLLFGYFLFMWFVGRFRADKKPEFPSEWPKMSLIVPCYNEEKEILNKLNDIRSLDYPEEKLEVVFVDGGSSDKTVNLLKMHEKSISGMKVVLSPKRGKINQINHVLPRLKGEIIVNTDCDSLLSPDALKWMAAEFSMSDEVKVVGAYCRPANTLDVEKYYWASQNKSRFIENDAMTSPIVIAQCYGFKKDLLDRFPDDVVADDIYIAFHANTLGYKTVYSKYAMAVETRSPETYRDFIPHKFRKSNAFLRESVRFLHRLPEMNSGWKMMLITRTFQQVLLPWIIVFWGMLVGALTFLMQFDMVLVGVLFVAVLFGITSKVFSWTDLPDGSHHYSIGTVIKGFSLTLLIMMATGLSYPFYRQCSSYRRLSESGSLNMADYNDLNSLDEETVIADEWKPEIYSQRGYTDLQ